MAERAAGGALRHEVLERLHAAGAAVLRLALEPLALLSDVARRGGVGHHLERVARLGYALEAEHLDRRRRAGGVHRLPALVIHRADAPVELPADEILAHP